MEELEAKSTECELVLRLMCPRVGLTVEYLVFRSILHQMVALRNDIRASATPPRPLIGEDEELFQPRLLGDESREEE
jgi:hypothetical protein